MRQFNGMLLCSIIPELSVVFFTIRGVFIPWDCLPKPSPTLNPNFCIILKAICSFSSGSFSTSILSSSLGYQSSFSSSESDCASVAYWGRQLCLTSSQKLGCWGSYSISMTFFCYQRFSFSIQEDTAALILIFFAESILLSLELRLAKVSFFLPPSYFDQLRGTATGSVFAIYGLLSIACGGVWGWSWGWGCDCREFIKLLSFFSSQALSFLSQNLGTGGGRLGRSINYITQ